MANFSKFCVRFLCVASAIIGLKDSGSFEDDTIAHAGHQTTRTKCLDILRRSGHMNSTQMMFSDWNVWSETASLPTAVQPFETADVILGRQILFCYTYFLVAENHDKAVHRAAVQGSDIHLLDGGSPLDREFVFEDNAILLRAFSPFDDSSFLSHSPLLFSSVPACQHSFSSRNLFFIVLSITLCLIVYQMFFQSKKQATSIGTYKDESVSSEPSEKQITKIAMESKGRDREILLDVDAPLSIGKPNCIVYKGTLRQRLVAVKVSYKAGSYSQASREPSEVKYLKHLHHAHVVKVMMSLSNAPFKIRLNSSHTQNGRTDMSYESLIVMEYCDRGTLHNGLKNRLFSEPAKFGHITTCALEIAQAMAHVHSKRIIHGALYAKHIFLQSSPADPRGFTCKVEQTVHHACPQVFIIRNQSAIIAAPEAIKSGFLCYASDVYAFGCLLYTMCVNQSPFSGHRRGEIQRFVVAGRRPEIPKTIPYHLTKLISECWSQCPHERPSFSSIVQKLKVCPHSQERRIPACNPAPLCRYKSVPAEALRHCTSGGLIPGKRYVSINFQPFTEPERAAFSASDLGSSGNKEERQVTARRTKSCSLSLERQCSPEMNNAAYVRRVDDLIKRSRRSESKAELKQFLKTLECK